jgi:hypothetical protein
VDAEVHRTGRECSCDALLGTSPLGRPACGVGRAVVLAHHFGA